MSEEPKMTKPKLSWWTSFGGLAVATTTVAASIITIVVGIPVLVGIFKHTPPPPPPTELQRTPELGLEFLNGTGNNAPYRMTLRDRGDYTQQTEVDAASGPFIIRFPSLGSASYGGMHICAWTDNSIFSIQPDKSWAAIDYDSPFVPGKGIADTHAGSADLPITKDANSYWVGSRIDHVSDTKDQIYISKADEVSLTERTKPLFLTIWIDGNLDGTINHNEFEYIVMHFHS